MRVRVQLTLHLDLGVPNPKLRALQFDSRARTITRLLALRQQESTLAVRMPQYSGPLVLPCCVQAF